MAQQNRPNSAGAYEDQKNNGNRSSDESIGGAQKGGAGYSRAQSTMPPDSTQKENHDLPVEGSREEAMNEVDRSK